MVEYLGLCRSCGDAFRLGGSMVVSSQYSLQLQGGRESYGSGGGGGGRAGSHTLAVFFVAPAFD